MREIIRRFYARKLHSHTINKKMSNNFTNHPPDETGAAPSGYSLPEPQLLAPIPTFSEDGNAEAEIAENSATIQNTFDGLRIDMPNKKRRVVSLREIAERDEWKNAARCMALPMLLGMDIDGNPVTADLAQMPHMLVAGAVGSGKSSCLNAIMAGFLLSRAPEDLPAEGAAPQGSMGDSSSRARRRICASCWWTQKWRSSRHIQVCRISPRPPSASQKKSPPRCCGA